ncbi:hypothetical protein V8F33_002493 [Rhypophila sp. PSN 637]
MLATLPFSFTLISVASLLHILIDACMCMATTTTPFVNLPYRHYLSNQFLVGWRVYFRPALELHKYVLYHRVIPLPLPMDNSANIIAPDTYSHPSHTLTHTRLDSESFTPDREMSLPHFFPSLLPSLEPLTKCPIRRPAAANQTNQKSPTPDPIDRAKLDPKERSHPPPQNHPTPYPYLPPYGLGPRDNNHHPQRQVVNQKPSRHSMEDPRQPAVGTYQGSASQGPQTPPPPSSPSSANGDQRSPMLVDWLGERDRSNLSINEVLVSEIQTK